MVLQIKLLTVEELAGALGVHKRTCWRLAAQAEAGQGRFPPPLRLGPKTVRWRLADVEAYLAHMADDSVRKYSSTISHN